MNSPWSHNQYIWIKWFPPNLPFVKLNTNESVEENQDYVGVEGLIRGALGQWIQGFALNIGATSSIEAEF
jgi:hypothetical protein